jgi:phosphoglucosamine mutase
MNTPPPPFGTDGVRAAAPQIAETVEPLMHAAGTELNMRPGDTALIAYDPRESSPLIAAKAAAGLMAVGINAEVVSEWMPTPGLAYSVANDKDLSGGVMITASHCAYYQNGVKIFGADGGKLSDLQQEAIERRRGLAVPYRAYGSLVFSSGRGEVYKEFLVKSAGGMDLTGTKLVIDTAHGAASRYAKDVFSELGAEVVPLHDDPNGRNINVESGATDMRVLSKVAAELGAIGIAHDGDADRCLMADENGRLFDGDRIVHLLGTAKKPDGNNEHEGVVMTVMTNTAIERDLLDRDIKMHRAQVGDRYVLEGLRSTKYNLGGEQSGHVIQKNLLGTGDGMLTAIHAIRAQRETGKTLEQLSAQLTLWPQVQAKVSIPRELMQDPRVQEKLAAEAERLSEVDARHVTRASGTEDIVRVMVEAPNARMATVTAGRLVNWLTNFAKAA